MERPAVDPQMPKVKRRAKLLQALSSLEGNLAFAKNISGALKAYQKALAG